MLSLNYTMSRHKAIMQAVGPTIRFVKVGRILSFRGGEVYITAQLVALAVGYLVGVFPGSPTGGSGDSFLELRSDLLSNNICQ